MGKTIDRLGAIIGHTSCLRNGMPHASMPSEAAGPSVANTDNRLPDNDLSASIQSIAEGSVESALYGVKQNSGKDSPNYNEFFMSSGR